MSERTETELLINLAMLDRFIGKIQTPGEGWECAAEDAANFIRRIIAERDAARKAQGEQHMELLRAADAIAAMQVTIAAMLTALEGVVRVADRQTVEFDAARAAIAQAKVTP